MRMIPCWNKGKPRFFLGLRHNPVSKKHVQNVQDIIQKYEEVENVASSQEKKINTYQLLGDLHAGMIR